jgi:hypothetical protein
MLHFTNQVTFQVMSKNSEVTEIYVSKNYDITKQFNYSFNKVHLFTVLEAFTKTLVP